MSWGRTSGLFITFAGFLVAAYLTLTHYQAATLGCPLGGGIVNCEDVLTSSYATIGPIPVSLFGVAWFGIMALLIWRPDLAGGRPALRIWTWAGTLTVLYLIYTELFQVGAICAWCSTVHVLVLSLFVLAELGHLSPT